MTKRALLWLLGIAALLFSFLAAINVSGTLAGVTFCGGFGNLDDWFGNFCDGLLPERFAWLTVGVAALIVFGYFAERSKPTLQFHDVTDDDNGSPEEPHAVYGSGSGAEPAVSARVRPDPPAAEQPEFKTCPDCAEEVRFAARKCRFCGYQFADATA